MMNRFLMLIGIVALIAGAFLAGVKEPGHLPLLDANRQRLAETENEGYAAGFTFWTTKNAGSDILAEEMRETHAYATEFDPPAVLPAFCLGAQAAGFGGNLQKDCEEWLLSVQKWPTYDGRLTDAWNTTYPYPAGDLGAGIPSPDDSRTGEREGLER